MSHDVILRVTEKEKSGHLILSAPDKAYNISAVKYYMFQKSKDSTNFEQLFESMSFCCVTAENKSPNKQQQKDHFIRHFSDALEDSSNKNTHRKIIYKYHTFKRIEIALIQ